MPSIRDDKEAGILGVIDLVKLNRDRDPALGGDAQKGRCLKRFAHGQGHVHLTGRHPPALGIIVPLGRVGNGGRLGRGAISRG